MNKPVFINLINIECWIVYLMPFSDDERDNYELVLNFQEECIRKKVFGMGWAIEYRGFDRNTQFDDETAEKYKNEYISKEGWEISSRAISGYKSISKGDYVVTRLKNGKYYVGKVKSEKALYLFREHDSIYNRLSWGAFVECWIEYSERDLPSEIAGRFSQRQHSTIQRIDKCDKTRQALLVIAMYENKQENNLLRIPKVRIGKSNYARSLTYMELEDLVSFFIHDKHNSEDYKLLPSSCKISQQNVEFIFVSNGKKSIACQVKNVNTIDIECYISMKEYERIYFFSGEWDDEKVQELNKTYEAYKHIRVISPTELYCCLQKNKLFSNEFYNYNDPPVLADSLNLKNFIICEKPNDEHECKISHKKDYVNFRKKSGLYYSSEFNALILTAHVMEDKVRELEYINEIIEEISSENNGDGVICPNQ